MKIGIITWFEDENYGTKLQALAMNDLCRKYSSHVELINYRIDERFPIISYDDTGTLRNQLEERNSWRFLKLLKKINAKGFKDREQQFEEVITNNCDLTMKITNDEEFINVCNNFDIIVFGSDQIWNPNWYHPYYFADIQGVYSYKIAYAPSLGVENIPEKRIDLLVSGLKDFHSLSSRESTGCHLLKRLTGRNDVIQVLDPTLLMSMYDWSKYESESVKITHDYILCYFVNDNYNHWHAVKKYSRKVKIPIVVIPFKGFSYIQACHTVPNVSVGDFLTLFRNAKYVITDSYHGSIFSLIYKKNFIAFERNNPNCPRTTITRLRSLFEILGLNNQILKYDTRNIDDIQKIDYVSVERKLNFEIEKSRKYMDDSIENYLEKIKKGN